MTGSMTRSVDPYSLVSVALDRYEEARRSREKVYVTRVAGRFSRGRGRGVEAGRALHGGIWALDPYDVLQYEELCTPFPLAWRFRFGWLLGVPDRLCFRRGLPYAVVEYKSYSNTGRAEQVQASLYTLLARLNFAAPVEALLHTPAGTAPIPGWQTLALEALHRVSRARRRRSCS